MVEGEKNQHGFYETMVSWGQGDRTGNCLWPLLLWFDGILWSAIGAKNANKRQCILQFRTVKWCVTEFATASLVGIWKEFQCVPHPPTTCQLYSGMSWFRWSNFLSLEWLSYTSLSVPIPNHVLLMVKISPYLLETVEILSFEHL